MIGSGESAIAAGDFNAYSGTGPQIQPGSTTEIDDRMRQSDLRIEEHYTDTAGFTDHVFALMHLLGFRFAPRIRDLTDRRCLPYPKIDPGNFPRAIEATVNYFGLSPSCSSIVFRS
jgi:hypothetical protein